ncbi:hypothetical protein Ccrd_007600 [Cynara cardunculus var. scolymus]|uniref:Uncharacterized protein n=1 Tax=Cynara cardunculus var. scolymus TaxID=59895 RepID=A0A103XGM8_CYNCS|nr:hypothetical protein Ccrd_007600 [Cynara cardunculus var. scolymus]
MRNLFHREPEVNANYDFTGSSSDVWQHIRVSMVMPPLTVAICICAVMSLMMFIERVYMTVVVLLVKFMGKKKYTQYKLEALKEDLEQNRSYPMVLVQVPMYNEKEVYKLSIGAVCSLTWPSDRLIVQVLDDSTNEILRVTLNHTSIVQELDMKWLFINKLISCMQALVELECKKWIQRGVNVKYETRNNRNGYKAGALREGLDKDYVFDCEFVVIFDADFQPEEDFLWRTVPYLLENPELALVQARWKFGTAGIWRIKAIEDAGGWKDRTTVEDMDLAVRASLKGWKFVFVGDLERVSIWKKLHVIYAFFFVRKIIAHWVTFFFYCVIIPICIMVPEVHLPKPIAIYVPATITILNSSCTLRSLHLLVFWILFENVMSFHRSKATIIGLLGANRVNEWVVTEKLGNATKQKSNVKPIKKARSRFGERLHFSELIMGLFLLYVAIYDMLFGKDHMFVYLLLQSGAFFVVGVGYVGISVSN